MTTLLQVEINETDVVYGEDRKEEYLNFIADWKSAASFRDVTIEEHLAFIIERSQLRKTPSTPTQLKEELKNAFGPVTNATKLANGRHRYDTLKYALVHFRYSKSTPKVYAELAAQVLTELRFDY